MEIPEIKIENIKFDGMKDGIRNAYKEVLDNIKVDQSFLIPSDITSNLRTILQNNYFSCKYKIRSNGDGTSRVYRIK